MGAPIAPLPIPRRAAPRRLPTAHLARAACPRRPARPLARRTQSDAAVAEAAETAKSALAHKARSRHSAFLTAELDKGREINKRHEGVREEAKLSASQGAGGAAADMGDSDGDGGGQDVSTFVGGLITSLHTFAQESAKGAFDKVVAASAKAAANIAGLERKAAKE